MVINGKSMVNQKNVGKSMVNQWLTTGKSMVIKNQPYYNVIFMWGKQCNFYQPWLGMVFIPPIKW